MPKEEGYSNLIPFNERSQDEVRSIASKGGVNSGRSRRKRKSMREALEYILESPASDNRLRNQVADLFGIDPEEVNNQSLILAAMLKQSLKGSVQAAGFIRDTVGEAPVKELQIEEVIPTPLAPIAEDEL
jgi:hypothetical protein